MRASATEPSAISATFGLGGTASNPIPFRNELAFVEYFWIDDVFLSLNVRGIACGRFALGSMMFDMF